MQKIIFSFFFLALTGCASGPPDKPIARGNIFTGLSNSKINKDELANKAFVLINAKAGVVACTGGIAIKRLDSVSPLKLSSESYVSSSRSDLTGMLKFKDMQIISPLALEPGNYAAVHINCQVSNRIITLGAPRIGGEYISTLGTFSVTKGEVVNLGTLVVSWEKKSWLSNEIRLTNVSVAPISDGVLETFAEHNPEYQGTIITRHITPTPVLRAPE